MGGVERKPRGRMGGALAFLLNGFFKIESQPEAGREVGSGHRGGGSSLGEKSRRLRCWRKPCGCLGGYGAAGMLRVDGLGRTDKTFWWLSGVGGTGMTPEV